MKHSSKHKGIPGYKWRLIVLVPFYLKKLESKKTNELEHIIQHPKEYHKDAIAAAREIMRKRGRSGRFTDAP